MAYLGKSDLNVEAQLDAGNRLRVSQITTQLDIKQTHDIQPLFYDREEIGGATQVYSNPDGGTTMAVTTTNDAAICQSKMFASYFSGKSQFMEITFDGFGSQTDVIKRAGYFTSNSTTPFNSNKDGFWFESDGVGQSLVIEKNGVEILNVDQADWNEDVFSGRDWDNFTVLVVQFLYLGGTAIRFGFIDEGFIKWAHTYVHSGLVSSTFITSPNKPIRYEIRSTGGAGSLTQICAQVASEGSVDEVGVVRTFDTGGIIDANSTGVTYALLGIRLKTAYKDVRVDTLKATILATTNDNFKYSLLLNPTVAGTFTYNDQTNSSLQLATGATANTVTGGTQLVAGWAEANASSESVIRSSLRLGSTIDDTMDTLVLCVTPLSSNLGVYGSISIQEFI